MNLHSLLRRCITEEHIHVSKRQFSQAGRNAGPKTASYSYLNKKLRCYILNDGSSKISLSYRIYLTCSDQEDCRTGQDTYTLCPMSSTLFEQSLPAIDLPILNKRGKVDDARPSCSGQGPFLKTADDILGPR